MALIHKAPANAGLSTTRTPSPVRAAGLLLGLTLLATVPLSACSATGEADPLPTSTLSAASTPSVDAHHTPAQQPQAQRTRARQAQATLTAFVDAARRGDAAVTTSLVSGRDPTFATRTRVWADNLQGIDWAAMTWTVRAQQAPLSAERRSALGADAWVQEVSVTWSLPGESRRAEERLWLTFVTDATVNDVTGAPGSGTGAPTGSGGTVRLAGERDGPSRLTATPLWLMQPVRLYTDDGVRLLTDADAGHAAHDWLRIAAAARAQTISR
ncbi:MAG: hypothetical protein L0H24_03505, partial [Microlunatus sp.]|nr:hypothetical protein [Microlunatus sp.]